MDARRNTGCQVRSAWFRGLKSDKHDLEPSLFREKRKTVTDILLDAGIKKTFLFKASNDKFKQAIDEAVLNSRMTMQNRKALSNLMIYVERRYNVVARTYIHNHLKKQHLSNWDLKISNALGAVLAEIDAFHEFKNRAHMDNLTSWDVLAQMRHRGVPTRLLDWSESCQIALHFALQDYLDKLIPLWSKCPWIGTYPEFPEIDKMRTPVLWVLNPFHVADLAGIKGAIPYPNHPPLNDYYNSFLVENDWPFERPIPIRAPRSDTRMEAQKGNFTVHGYNTKPLNLQMSPGKSEGCLASVVIPPAAAVYGAFYIWQLAYYDAFDLMRDNDTLGKVVTQRHLS